MFWFLSSFFYITSLQVNKEKLLIYNLYLFPCLRISMLFDRLVEIKIEIGSRLHFSDIYNDFFLKRNQLITCFSCFVYILSLASIFAPKLRKMINNFFQFRFFFVTSTLIKVKYVLATNSNFQIFVVDPFKLWILFDQII